MGLRKMILNVGKLSTDGAHTSPYTSASGVEVLKPGIQIKSGSDTWTNQNDQNVIQIQSPWGVRQNDTFHAVVSGTPNTTDTFIIVDAEPAHDGSNWEVTMKVTTAPTSAITMTTDDYFVYVPDSSSRVKVYPDSEGVGTAAQGPHTPDSGGHVVGWVSEPMVDVRLLATGVTTRIYREVSVNAGENEITPDHFGAVGDGTTDDSVALQTAVTHARYANDLNKVTIPPQTYYIPTFCNVDGQVEIAGFGDSSILLGQDLTATRIFVVSADHVNIHDLKLVGATSTQVASASAAIEVDNSADFVEIRNVWFTGTGASAGWNQGVQVGPAVKNLQIEGCKFQRVQGTTQPQVADAITIWYGVAVAADTAQRLTVTNCRSTQTSAQGTCHVILGNGSNQCTVSDCHLESGRYSAIYIWGVQAVSVATRNMIVNNKIMAPCDIGSAGTAGILLEAAADRNIIADNVIFSSSLYGIHLEGDGTNATSCDRNQVTGNTIDTCTSCGIQISGASYNVIRGNSLWTNGSATQAMITLVNNSSSNADFNWIQGNFATNTGAKYTLLITTGDNNVIYGNYMVDGSTADYLDSGSGNRFHLNDTVRTLEIITSENASLPANATIGGTLLVSGISTLTGVKHAGTIDCDGQIFDDKAYAFSYIANADVAASGAFTSTYVKVGGTATSVQKNRFDALTTTAGGEWIYTSGEATKRFRVSWSGSIEVNVVGVISLAVGIDNVAQDVYSIQIDIATADLNVPRPISGTQILTLSGGNIINLWVKTTGSSSLATMRRLMWCLEEI